MAKANLGNLVGGWAFIIGVVLAVVIGLFPTIETAAIVTALVIIGLIVGLLNIGDKEVMPFLLSGAVLIIAAGFGKGVVGIAVVDNVLKALLIIFVPATIIVALKNVFTLARKA